MKNKKTTFTRRCKECNNLYITPFRTSKSCMKCYKIKAEFYIRNGLTFNLFNIKKDGK